MLPQIEPLADEHIREEIGKLMAQTAKLAAEQAKFDASTSMWLPIIVVMVAAGAGAIVAVAFSRLCYG